MSQLTPEQAKMVIDLMKSPPMTLAVLINALEEIEREYGGDLPVVMHDDTRVHEVCAYDADGDTRGARVEVVIHGVR